jgi:hypothetical protein
LFLVSEIAKLCVSASLTDCGAIEPDELLSMLEILLKSEWMSRWVRCKSQTTILAMTRPNAIRDNRIDRFPLFLTDNQF